jgi:sulfide:quinone oxidoreductase
MPTNVLIAGGGPAALEAALVLRRTAGAAVATTLLAPGTEFTYRPLTVLSPFAAGGAAAYPLDRIAADAGFTRRAGMLARVDPAEHAVETAAGERLAYDFLLVALGARAVPPFAAGLTFTGAPADAERLHGLVQDVEAGYARRVAFVVPTGSTWPLPVYELALMLAERGFEAGEQVEIHLVTPEDAPLGLFGADAAREVGALLAEAGIAVHLSAHAALEGRRRLVVDPSLARLDVDRVVTVPVIEGRPIPGLPSDSHGFLVVDRHGAVQGVADVYAAGDITAFPVKQGGIACQQADAAAEAIAARAGAEIEPAPFTPVLRGMLLTERWARFLRRESVGNDAEASERALWWPPTKIAGRELAGYLERLDAEAGRDRGGLPVTVHLDDPGAAVETLAERR